MAALTIDFRWPYRESLTPFDTISNKLRGLPEIENINQRNARQCPKLAVACLLAQPIERLLWRKQAFKFSKSTTIVDPN
jgi:hypothetical protein